MSEMGYTPRTFSVVFAEGNYDESVYARQVATRFGCEHTEIRLTEAAMLGQLPDALAAMDQPTGDGVNTYVVSRAVKEAGVTVALSGLGGDEFFVGYPSFLRLEKALKRLRPQSVCRRRRGMRRRAWSSWPEAGPSRRRKPPR